MSDVITLHVNMTPLTVEDRLKAGLLKKNIAEFPVR